MRRKPMYRNGRRIYYLERRKIEKRWHKIEGTAAAFSACMVLTGAVLLQKPGQIRGGSATVVRAAGVSAYSAALVRTTTQKTADNANAVGAKETEADKAVSAAVDQRLREEAGLAERRADFAVQQKAEEEARLEAERKAQEEAARIAAEEAAKKAAEEAAEQAKMDAADGNVPMEANRSAHPYMPYTAVTNTGTKQYQVLNGADAWSDPVTGLRMVGDRICIAIGQGYGMKAGDKVNVVLDDGSYVKCILGDMKANVDTDPTGRYHNVDGDVVEMIVDYSVFGKNPSQYLGVFHGQPVKKLVRVSRGTP